MAVKRSSKRSPEPPLHQIISETDGMVLAADKRFEAAHNGKDCTLCNAGPDIAFSMAFQPIVDAELGKIKAYEALARGPHGEPASTVLDHTLHNNRYSIDQRCREKAIAIAAAIGLLDTSADLNINFYPNAVYEPNQCLLRILNAANAVGFPLTRIILEVTEVEKVRDPGHLHAIMTEYRKHGLRVAIDDFGAGHSGLSLLSVFQPDLIKIDRGLIENIHQRPASRTIIRSILQVCRDLNVQVIAEGVECREEMQILCDLGISMMQGFFFARPGFELLPQWP